MTLIFYEGYESMSSSTVTEWYTFSGTPTITTSLPDSRAGSGLTVSANGYQVIDLGANYTDIYMGFAIYKAHSSNTTISFISSTPTINVTINYDNSGVFWGGISTASTPFTNGTTARSYPAFRWHYIETYVLINNTTGAFTLKVNGVTEVSLTNIDTFVSGNVDIRTIRLIGNGISNTHYDDVYICTSAGSSPWNGFLGEVKSSRLVPDGAGTTTTWTPSAGSNYQNVDESPDDGDTTYNSHTTVGDIDLYTYGNLASTATTVRGVRTATVARKTTSATRVLRPLVRTNSTNYDGDDFGLSTSYLGRGNIWQANPNTSSAWTPTEVNAIEAGVKIQS